MTEQTTGTDQALREEIRKLGDLLGQVIREQEGEDLFETEEEIRRLSKQVRQGDLSAADRLNEKINALDLRTASSVARAFTLFFDLANQAEDRHRVRVLRERERGGFPEPRKESIGAAIRELKAAGYSAEEVLNLLQRIVLEPVFTAHPTEAKRRTIRAKLARLREYLTQLDNEDLLERERRRLDTQIHAELTSLWQTDLLRFRRPSVLDEVEYGLSFLKKLWNIVPKLSQDLYTALHEAYPEIEFEFPHILKFGSWIGGDRDGNPNVTPEITRKTFELHHRAAVHLHLSTVRQLLVTLSSSEKQVRVNAELKQAIQDALRQWPDCRGRVEDLSPYEPYRHWLLIIEWRLEQTLKVHPELGFPDGIYRRVKDLHADAQLMLQSLRDNNSEILIIGALREWKWQIEIFGFHLARLDLREDSSVHRSTMNEILTALHISKSFGELQRAERERILSSVSYEWLEKHQSQFSKMTQRTIRLFHTAVKCVRIYGSGSLGGYVISMTHTVEDMLIVLWLGRLTGLCHCHQSDSRPCPLRIVPLFETVKDLENAPDTLRRLCNDPCYAAHLRTQENRQMVMIGYSDSTKDGGYLMANWSLYQAQRDLCRAAEAQDVQLLFFHGRGGSLGRGGGPAARGIMALPPESVACGIRMTEQGEVLAERYDNPAVTYRHLEQVIWATLMVNTQYNSVPKGEWLETCQTLAGESYRSYRNLVEHPEFVEYFHQASPLSEIEALPIGSRPSRRSGSESLEDLRAIPWVFAWTQNRHLLPAWYGLGQAFTRVIGEKKYTWDYLRKMYREWPFFHAIINNALFGLAKADMHIAHSYLELAKNKEQAGEILEMVMAGYEISRDSVLELTELPELLENIRWLKRSIEVRNPYVDPLNLIQIAWLRRLRQMEDQPESEEKDQIQALIRVTIYGIASGMRTTG